MDYECHAPFDQVLDKFAAPIGLVTPKHSNEPTPNGVFSNSMMISATNVHFFWHASFPDAFDLRNQGHSRQGASSRVETTQRDVV